MSDADTTCTQAIRDAIKARYPDTQVVLDGIAVVELLEAGEPNPVIRTIKIGGTAPWTAIGLLRAAQMESEDILADSWEADEDQQ